MLTQVKITDYFTSLKSKTSLKSSLSLRSGDKICVHTLSSDLLSPNQTPKRKLTIKREPKNVSSSKRRKTQRNCNKNETKTDGEATQSLVKEQHKPKQITAEEVIQKLGKCSNLMSPKKGLETINDCAVKVKKFKEIKIASPVKVSSTPLKSSSLPPVKAYSTPRNTPNKHTICSPNYRRRLFDIYDERANTPNKEEDRDNDAKDRVNNFERFNHFKHLTLKHSDSQSLSLPKKYKVLAKAFRCSDYVVFMLTKRQQMCTFDKLKQSVEGMTHKTFDTKVLTQIRTVFPDAFVLEYENNKSNPQLTITANYSPNSCVSQLQTRYRSFNEKLLDITKEHHNRYLSSLSVPISIDSSQLCPKFKLNEVPDIEANDNSLPVQPSKSGCKSVENFLGISKSPKKFDNVVVNDTNIDSNTSTKITKGVLKGLSMNFLNKVRANEAAILTKEMTRKPEVEKQLLMIKRLPKFIQIIHDYYISEKKAIRYDELVNKIIDSYDTCLSIIDTKEHLDYLIKLLPDWIYVLDVNKSLYVRIEKNKSIKELIEVINKHSEFLKTN